MNVGDLVAYLRLEDSHYRKGLAKANSAAAGFGKVLAAAGGGTIALGGAVQVLGGIAAIAGQAAGAVGLLPAVVGAAKFGIAALTMATEGFGAAITAKDPAAFAAAIAELSPAAREAAIATRAFKPAWDSMKDSLQERLFAGVAEQVSALGGTYLPILQGSMGRVAGAANEAGLGVADMLGESARVRDVDTMTSAWAKTWENILPAVAPLGGALLDVGTVGSTVLADLTGGTTGAAREFAAFIATARETGALEQWIRNGVEAMRQLGEVGGNIGEVLGGIWRAADQGGASFLERLVSITQQIADMVNSADGQAALGTFFQTAATLSGLLMEALRALLPVLPPLVQVLGIMATTVGSVLVGALVALAPLLEAFATWLAANPALVSGVTIALGALLIAGNGLLALVRVMGIVQTVWASGLLQMAGRAIATAAIWIAQWVVMAATSLARAAVMAASWLLAMGPIGWVIAAVAGLVALIIANWDTVVAWTSSAWTAVTGFVTDAWNNITAFVSSAVASVVGFITGAWDSAVSATQGAWTSFSSAVSGGISAALGFVAALPGRVLGFLAGMGSLLINSGSALVQGFLDGIVNAWNRVVDFVRQGVQWVRNLFPFSPAKTGPFSGSGYVTHSGKALTGDFAESLRAGMPGVIASARALMDAAHIELLPPGVGALPSMPGSTPIGPAGINLGADPADDVTVPRRGGPGDSPDDTSGVTVIINNPTAERGSDSLNREARTLSATGVL